MTRRHALSITVLFEVFIFSLMIVSLTDSDREASYKENRTLAQRPKLTVKSLLDGSFAKEFEEYFQDQFPFRDFFMDTSFKFTTLMARKGEDDVSLVEGGEGADYDENTNIFNPPSGFEPIEPTPSPEPTVEPTMTPGSPQATPGEQTPTTTPAPTKTPVPTPAPTTDISYEYNQKFLRIGDRILEVYWYSKQRAESYFNVLKRVADELPNAKIYALLTPSSVELYTPEKYKGYGHSSKEAIDYLFSNMDKRINQVNVYDKMMSKKNEYIYFRTDHHWTQRGAYYAYEEFCKAANIKARKMNEYKKDTVPNFLGSYFKYIPDDRFRRNPDYLELFYTLANNEGRAYYDISMNLKNSFAVKAVRTPNEMKDYPAKYMVFMNGDNPLTHFKTGVDNNKRIVVFKDSYGNSLVPFLLSHYEDVYVIDIRAEKYLSGVLEFIKQKGINEVLFVNYVNCPTQSDAFVSLDKML